MRGAISVVTNTVVEHSVVTCKITHHDLYLPSSATAHDFDIYISVLSRRLCVPLRMWSCVCHPQVVTRYISLRWMIYFSFPCARSGYETKYRPRQNCFFGSMRAPCSREKQIRHVTGSACCGRWRPAQEKPAAPS